MHRTKILLVINKNSGSSDTDPSEIIGNMPEADRPEYEVIYLSGEDDNQDIRETITRFQPDVVAAVGGDGTVNLVASLIMNSKFVLGIIPAGSANGLATELGIPTNPADAFSLLLNGQAKPMDVVEINNNRISLHLSDAGINARIVREFEREGTRGFTGYIKHFFRELTQPQRSFRCTIKTEYGTYHHRSYMTIIANASSYRTGANMNPSGKIDDGKFEIILFKPYSRWIWRSIIGAFTGTLHKQPNVETYQCIKASVFLKPAQQLQIDGESIGLTSSFSAKIAEHALKIVLP